MPCFRITCCVAVARFTRGSFTSRHATSIPRLATLSFKISSICFSWKSAGALMVTVRSSSSNCEPVSLKSKRWASSRLAWSTALVNSWLSISETTSNDGMGSTIPARLQREKLCIAAVLGGQRIMAAALDDAPLVQHQDLIGHAHRREAMRDDDGDAVAGELAEVLEHLG